MTKIFGGIDYSAIREPRPPYKFLPRVCPLIILSKPLLEPVEPWEGFSVHSHRTIKTRDGQYYMYYVSQGGSGGVGLATSSDGLTFTKEVSNPLIRPVAGTWRHSLTKVQVLQTGKNDFRMWLGGFDGHKGSQGYFTSTDGKTWIEPVANPIVTDLVEWGMLTGIFYDHQFNRFYGRMRLLGSDDAMLVESVDGVKWNIKGQMVSDISSYPGLMSGGMGIFTMMHHGPVYIAFFEVKREIDPVNWVTGVAYSADLLNWKVDPRSPMLAPSFIPGDYAEALRGDPCLVAESDHWKVYHSMMRWTPSIRGTVGLAYIPYDIPIQLSYPILEITSLAAGATSPLADSQAIFLSLVNSLSLTIEVTYHASATAGVRLDLYSSTDMVNYDTDIFTSITPSFTAGATVRRTEIINPKSRFLKGRVVNLDGARAATNIKVIATVGG